MTNRETLALTKSRDQQPADDEPMTKAQRGYLRSLGQETNQKINPHLTKGEASHLIQKLLAQKRTELPSAA